MRDRYQDDDLLAALTIARGHDRGADRYADLATPREATAQRFCSSCGRPSRGTAGQRR